MNTVLKEEIHTASKDYSCDACENLCVDDFMIHPNDYGVSYPDKRILAKIRQENYKILKGTKYLYQVGIYDGFYTIRCRLDAVEICNKYHLYDED